VRCPLNYHHTYPLVWIRAGFDQMHTISSPSLEAFISSVNQHTSTIGCFVRWLGAMLQNHYDHKGWFGVPDWFLVSYLHTINYLSEILYLVSGSVDWRPELVWGLFENLTLAYYYRIALQFAEILISRYQDLVVRADMPAMSRSSSFISCASDNFCTFLQPRWSSFHPVIDQDSQQSATNSFQPVHAPSALHTGLRVVAIFLVKYFQDAGPLSSALRCLLWCCCLALPSSLDMSWQLHFSVRFELFRHAFCFLRDRLRGLHDAMISFASPCSRCRKRILSPQWKTGHPDARKCENNCGLRIYAGHDTTIMYIYIYIISSSLADRLRAILKGVLKNLHRYLKP